MSVVRTKIDYSALSEGLLDLAKEHMRVEFTRDDAYITRAVARAIDLFERTTETAVNPAVWSWAPVVAVYGPDGAFGYAVPFQPQPTIQKVVDANALDVTANWFIRGGPHPDHYGPRVLVSKTGEPTSAITATVATGYTDPDTMPPGIVSFVLEAAAWFYENREAGPMPGVDGVPYLNQLLTAYWRPRA